MGRTSRIKKNKIIRENEFQPGSVYGGTGHAHVRLVIVQPSDDGSGSRSHVADLAEPTTE
jgi:hypothetical protein